MVEARGWWRALVCIGAMALLTAAGCSDDGDGDTAPPAPCGGACPADQCLLGMCVDNMEPDPMPTMDPNPEAEPDPMPNPDPNPNPDPMPGMDPEPTPNPEPDPPVCMDEIDAEDDCNTAIGSPDTPVVDTETSFDGTICAGDTDHFSVEMTEGQILFMDLRTQAEISFELLTNNCGSTLAADGTELEYEATGTETVVVRVLGNNADEEGDYELRLTLGAEPPGCPDDVVDGLSIEPNNNADEAVALDVDRNGQDGIGGVSVCDGDEDWFTFDVDNAGDTVVVTFIQNGEDDDLDFEVLDGNESVLAQGSGDGVLSFETPVTGQHFVRVFFDGTAPRTGFEYSVGVEVNEPVPCTPDDLEPNDETPATIARGNTSANFCPDDDVDKYAFELRDGDTVDITLTYDHDALDNAEQVTATLFGPGGDNDVRSFLVRDGNSDIDILPDPIVVDAPGTWTLEIADGVDDLSYDIDLDIEGMVIEQCGVVDANEPNDDCANAPSLPPFLEVDGFICGPAGDEDWFKIVVSQGQSIDVQASLFHFEGNLDMILYEPDGETLIDLSFDGDDLERIQADNLDAGNYCVRIFADGPLTENSYSIEVEID